MSMEPSQHGSDSSDDRLVVPAPSQILGLIATAIRDRAGQVGAIGAHVAQQMALGASEAKALLNAAGDESDFPTLASHIATHPPSAFAIAHLVWLVRAYTEDRLSRRKLPDRLVHEVFDALPQRTVPALRKNLEERGLDVPEDRHLRQALKRGNRNPVPAKRGRRPKAT